MTTIDLPLLNSKTCGTCTSCCEGWISADIRGNKIYPGKPCIFVKQGVGCGDYENRPEDPCKVFLCGWRQIEEMPDEFKPDKSGVLINFQERLNGFFVLTKAPNNPTAEFLSWMISYARGRGINILWYINDKSYWLGDEEFCKQMKIQHGV